MNWIKHPIILQGELVKLIPLERSHFAELLNIGANPDIWEFISINGADPQRLKSHLESAVLKRATGEQYPFTVICNRTGKIIGSTMFHNIFSEHRKLEIGWTWYHPSFWRTGYNRECKLLLLSYCFEVLNTIRVQFVTDENNFRSRNAILGIGATFEGILRYERIRANGVYRNTAIFSIIENEWQIVKPKIKSAIIY